MHAGTHNFRLGALLSLVALNPVHGGAVHRRSPQGVNIDVCFQVPLWAYESPEVLAFCGFVNSIGGGGRPPSTVTSTVTRTATASSTSTLVISQTVSSTTTSTSTPTQTQFTFFTPVVTETVTETTSSPTCPAQKLFNKRDDDRSPSVVTLTRGADTAESDVLTNMPNSLRNLGLALPEIENLCFCVINRFGPPRTSTRTVTALTTTTRVTSRTVTSTSTSVSTFTVFRTDVFTTQTITAPTSVSGPLSLYYVCPPAGPIQNRTRSRNFD